MKNLLWMSITLLFFNACADQHATNIPGNWQAIEVLEKDKAMEVDPTKIKFWFGENNQYRYEGTLNYREAGTYHIENQYLYTIDTVNQASTEKAVEIVLLTTDSLFIRMSENGKERLMKLKKQN